MNDIIKKVEHELNGCPLIQIKADSAARMLRIEDREHVANAAALLLAKRHNLLGTAG